MAQNRTKEQIKDIRAASGLSQVKFAQRYGIPRRSIENWESGITECPSYVVNLLRRVVEEDFGKAQN